MNSPRLICFTACLLAAGVARAEPTRELYIEGRQEVFEGDPVTSRLTARGRIRPGLTQSVQASDLGGLPTRMAKASDGVVWIGTAGGGLHRVFRGETRRVLDDATVVTAAAFDGGIAYATAADAQVYVVRDGDPQPLVKLEPRYVWALVARKKTLWAATGDPGQLIRIEGGRAEKVFEAEETHLRSLALTADGVLFGGGNEGIVYHWASGRVRALYDSPMGEVTALAWDADREEATAAIVSSDKSPGLPAFRWVGAIGDDDESDDSPFKGSEVVRIDAEGRVEVLWRSQREGVLDLKLIEQAVVFSTGGAASSKGRMYRSQRGAADDLEVMARFDAAMAPAFVAGKDGSLLVGVGPSFRVLEVGPKAMERSEYLSTEQDFQRVGRLGRIWFDAEIPQGAEVSVALRTGNTAEVDPTWSDWSKAVVRPEGGKVDLPEGRYAQFRVQMKSSKGNDPVVRSMHASVVRLNDPPRLLEVFSLKPGVALAPLPVNVDRSKTVALSSGNLNKLRPRNAGDDPQVRMRQTERAGAQTVAWHASDTNGDTLVFTVELQALGDSGWTRLAEGLSVPFTTFDSRAFPDGRYVVRVTASDRPSNHPGSALSTSRTSDPFLLDNAPPVIENLRARRSPDGGILVEAEARDRQSSLTSAQVAVDGGPWLLMPSKQGLVDSPEEALRVRLQPEEVPDTDAPKSQVVSVRVRDDAGNESVASTGVR